MTAFRRALFASTIGRVLIAALLVSPLAGALAVMLLVAAHRSDVATLNARALAEPSRLYARPDRLTIGQTIDVDVFETMLVERGYRLEREADSALVPGRYRRDPGGFEVYLRSSVWGASDARQPRRAEIAIVEGRLDSIRLGGEAAEHLELDPLLLASYRDDRLIESRPIAVADLPEHVVRSFLAAEDATFFDHAGISLPGIVRAAWFNVRAGGVRQGGSTITQQLVKNVFLTPERTFTRKAREAILALAVERRFGKSEILEAYLNEIYFGVDGPVNLIGLGAAAHAYYGKHPRDLTVAEAATLASMVAAPARYHPERHPERTRLRRDSILARMVEHAWLSPDLWRAMRARPLGLARVSSAGKRAGFFSDVVIEEAAHRFGIEDLEAGGYRLYSTLSWRDQIAAEAAARDSLDEVETRRHVEHLETALVSIDPRDGAIVAYVGGRDYAASPFDRASMARRQPGSAFKPIVYATALAHDVANPFDMIDDVPTEIHYAGGLQWRPRNDDRSFRGKVSLRTALASSLNVPTVRLALASGLDSVCDIARMAGVRSHLDEQPSLALGAFEVTPIELATVYTTFAAGGVRRFPHGLARVEDRQGIIIAPRGDPDSRRTLREGVAFELTELLRDVVDHGTGRGVRRLGLHDPVAGKTGTSSEARDSWFAGYSADRVTVVWVGRDDNGPTRLSGSRVALPIWTMFMKAVRPTGGYPPFSRPRSLIDIRIDPESGLRATARCPHAVTRPMSATDAPGEACPLTHEPAPPAIDGSGHELVVTNLDAEVEVATAGLDDPPEPAYEIVDMATARETLRVRATGGAGAPGTGILPASTLPAASSDGPNQRRP